MCPDTLLRLLKVNKNLGLGNCGRNVNVMRGRRMQNCADDSIIEHFFTRTWRFSYDRLVKALGEKEALDYERRGEFKINFDAKDEHHQTAQSAKEGE